MADAPSVDILEQIASVERELRMRDRVYPRWVENGKMSPQKAKHEIACMEAVLRTLMRERDAGRLL